ncbi:MAG: LacI family DNA-binding transcriptional regulator [Clostridium sp.]|jgi:LacI family kdg operon repressor|uniref:LacI family DNA-binding transcriptional regulator n=1 Tax=Clostridium sp. TaxID=1506 RepID=UPI0025BF435E|nr:LacI family DNA-binding transcriptional regulator [Clostridium sp.]MCH3964922.1 LacI family DNA-binding transcriptional regulator [Clostridium sp.]MCI1716584.1 LacI family DNA-binding transcriptional regulator [Clostridium sp.]MCI1800934.1 LacI family DNA-binding transcriptional regulator [Clostridium sp.]MCI1814761.1 LacI family DNA-binding transcriptional regulator [Clostridium sp.]MCI1871681.1 LacI family DNA-binding transcriptional regulator [Clostridium sp.]
MKDQKKITIDDVAEKAGVSKSTISRYLNGKFEFMSENTRNRIEKVIEELDYRPNNTARTLKLKKSRLIGVVMADLTNPFSSILIKGIGDGCRKYNYNIIITNADNDKDREKEYLLSLMDQNVDGIIINGTGYNEELLIHIKNKNVPVVMLDRIVNSKFFDGVTSNNYEMTFNIVNYLIDEGFHNAALFTPPVGNISSRIERKKAFIEVCSKRLDSSNFGVYVLEDYNEGDIESKLLDFVENHSGTKAVFAINGVVLLNVLNNMRKLKLKIPDDAGICGYDDWGWAALIPPGITTISQPSYDMGFESAKILMEKIRRDNLGRTTCVYLKSSLKVRGSTNLKSK